MLIKRDMQQFFRSGFRQVREAVFTSECQYVFAVPSFLDDPILSLEATESIEIVEKPPAVKLPVGVNADFMTFIMESCGMRRELLDTTIILGMLWKLKRNEWSMNR